MQQAGGPWCHQVVERVEVEEFDAGTAEAEDVFTAFYIAEFPRAVRLAHLLTGVNPAAEDIAQDVMLRLRDRLDVIDDPAAYLTRSVTNACWNWHRTQRRDRARMARLATAPTVVVGPETEQLLTIVDGLPFRQRTALVGRYWLDLPDADIAELIGVRPATVRSLVARALRSMKGRLG